MSDKKPIAKTEGLEPGEDKTASSAALHFHLADFLPYRLSVTTNRISRAFARHYQDEFGLSIPEWRVLAILGNYAPISSNEICDRTAMDKAKVSRAVSQLIANGLVQRETHANDQRLLELSLTRKGRNVYAAIVPRAQAIERHITAGMTANEITLLRDLLDRLSQKVDE